MSETYEPVHEVVDDYQGPRSGFADFRGKPHWFCALGWESLAAEGEAERRPSTFDPGDDRFYLVPVTAPNGSRIFAQGTFRTRQADSDSATDLPPAMEVLWRPYGCLAIV